MPLHILCGQLLLPQEIEKAEHPLNKHLPWLKSVLARHPSIPTLEEAQMLIKDQVGQICVEVLRDCAVYKNDDHGRAGLINYLTRCGIDVKQ
jgi:galactose-1-phosphate uridylyltransferase